MEIILIVISSRRKSGAIIDDEVKRYLDRKRRQARSKLRKLIKDDMGYKLKYIADELGMSQSKLSKKLSLEQEFTELELMYLQEYIGVSMTTVLTGEPESFNDAAEELASYIREIGLGSEGVMSIKIALEAAYKKGKASNED